MRDWLKTIILAMLVVLIVGCNTSKGVETRTIEPEPMESVSMQLTTDGGSFVVNVDENNESTVFRFDSEGNLLESVDVTVTVNDDGTFEISVTFSDGTTVTITGELDENGHASDIHLYIDGKEEDASVSLDFSGDTSEVSTQPKAATPKIVKVSVGDDQSYALDENGDVWTWDDDDDKPEKVDQEIGTTTDISSGDDFACSEDTSGRAFCWKNNEVEDATLMSSNSTKMIETTGSTVCIIYDDDSALCWNSLEFKKPVARFSHVLNLSIAKDEVCAIILATVRGGEKKIRCRDLSSQAIKELPGSNAVDIVSGDYHHCIITESKNVRCWGKNADGQLGLTHSLIDERAEPTEDIDCNISGEEKEIRAASNHTCVLSRDSGDISCWGQEIGKSSTNAFRKTTSQTDFVDFDVGNRQNCAVDVKGDVWCWTGINTPTKIQF